MRDLTVAICMYNAARYIEETLGCLMAQTVQDYQLLIINDCSTDTSPALVRAFFQQHPRPYQLINLPENQGLAAGRRYVELHANTRYILFVDADDDPLPTLVERLYDTITADDDLMAVGCHLAYMDAKGKPIKGGIFLGETTKEGFRAKAAAGKRIFMQPTAIYDRRLALRVGGHAVDGFPPGKPRYRDLCEDLDLWTRMSDLYTEGKAIIVVPEVLCRYRKHEQAMSADSTGMVLRMEHIKNNVRRRRAGHDDLTFVDYLATLSPAERTKIQHDAAAADNLRRAYYHLRHKRVVSSLVCLIKSVYNRPAYLLDKVRHNILGKG